MIDEKSIFLALLLETAGSVVYFIATLKGKTKPNRVTWFLWMIIPFIAFFAQVKQNVGVPALFTFANGIGPFFILIASFVNKKSEWKITRFDIICGILALIGLFLWYLTRVGNIAIIFSILADLLAALPTVVKAYKAPETENAQSFLLSTGAALITLLTITFWNFASYGFPLYVVLINGTIFVLSQYKIKKYFTRKTS